MRKRRRNVTVFQPTSAVGETNAQRMDQTINPPPPPASQPVLSTSSPQPRNTHPKPTNPNPTPSLTKVQVPQIHKYHSTLRLNKTQLASPFPKTSYHAPPLPLTAVHRTTQYFRVIIPEYPLPFQKAHPTNQVIRAFHPVLQRRPSMIEPGGLEGEGSVSGLLKMGIEGGVSFNVLVSKNSRNSYGNFYLRPLCGYLLLRSRGSGALAPVYLLHFASFSYHFNSFFASNYLQIPLFTILLEGVLSYNPRVRKSAFPAL